MSAHQKFVLGFWKRIGRSEGFVSASSSPPDYALHHHREADLAFIPSTQPTHLPALNAIAQYRRLPQSDELSPDLQLLQSTRCYRRGRCRWQELGLAGDVQGIAQSVHCESGFGSRLRLSAGSWRLFAEGIQ